MLGEQLRDLCQSAKRKVWLVAPFMKYAVLQRLLESMSSDVRLICVTRWRPEEIAMGVSDVDIWLLLKERGNSQLWIRHDLHAKYYRADGQCLVGSANLTATALGWSAQANLELLLDVPIDHPALMGFETTLLTKAIQVDSELYEQTKLLISALAQAFKSYNVPEIDAPTTAQIDREAWLPSLRNPESLYVAYQGRGDTLTEGAYENAQTDLYALQIPLGLSKIAFEAYVRYTMMQMPLVRKVDAFVAQPRRFGEVSAYLKTLPCARVDGFNSKFAWQTLMRWMLYFMPHRYQSWVDSYSEMISVKIVN